MPVHILPDYNRQWMNEKVFRVHCLNTISCLRAPVFYPFPCYTILHSDCARILSLFF